MDETLEKQQWEAGEGRRRERASTPREDPPPQLFSRGCAYNDRYNSIAFAFEMSNSIRGLLSPAKLLRQKRADP